MYFSPSDAFRSRRILVADDNRDIAHTFSMMLSIIGHEVQTAYDGGQAVAMALAMRPDVVFLDIGLPTLDGFEVCNALRAEFGRDLSIFAVTGHGDDEFAARGKDCFDGFFTKPISPLDLLERIGLAPLQPTQ